MANAVNEQPAPDNGLDGPDIFVDGVVGAFQANGNVHITLVAKRSDYGAQPPTLTDVVIGRLVMPLPAAERMVEFLSVCLEAIKRPTFVSAEERRKMQ